jgi:hypothetical protein
MNDARNAESKARLAAAIETFTPRRPIRYAALWPYKDEIETLRSKKASCRVIRDLLQQANVRVSLDTVARFCREVVEGKPGRPTKTGNSVRKPRRAASDQTSDGETDLSPQVLRLIAEQREDASKPEPEASSRRGPRIADPKNV